MGVTCSWSEVCRQSSSSRGRSSSMAQCLTSREKNKLCVLLSGGKYPENVHAVSLSQFSSPMRSLNLKIQLLQPTTGKNTQITSSSVEEKQNNGQPFQQW